MEAKKSFREALCTPKVPKVVEKPKIIEEPKVVEVTKILEELLDKSIPTNSEEPKYNKKKFKKGEFSYESIQIGKYYTVQTTDDNDWKEEVDILMKCTDKKNGYICYCMKLDPHCMWPGVGYSPIYSSSKFSDGKIKPLPADYWKNQNKYAIKKYYWEDDFE